MTTYLNVRDLIEELQRLDPDARVELEIRHETTHDKFNGERDQVECWIETEPLATVHTHCDGRRYVTLRA